MDKLPDIVFIADYNFFVRDFFTEEEFSVSDFCAAHHPEGIFIAYGKDIVKNELSSANLIDVMPTILHTLGCKIPRWCEGNVLKDIFRKGSPLHNQQTILISEKEQRDEDEKRKIGEILKGIKI